MIKTTALRRPDAVVGLSIGLAAASLMGAAPAPAGLEAAFGNTIVSTYPDGRTAELRLQRDGRYTAEGRRHDPSSGKWTAKGDKLCLKQSSPIPAPFAFCAPMIRGGVGTTWTGKAVTGEAIRLKLVAGS